MTIINRKNQLIFIIYLMFTLSCAYSCTVVSINNDRTNMVARNFDWHTGSGFIQMDVKGERKQVKHLKKINKSSAIKSWQVNYSSIIFHAHAPDDANPAVGGINSTGLSIEQLDLELPKVDGDFNKQVPVLDEEQLINYLLDTCKNVKEVLQKLHKINITHRYRVHFFITDKQNTQAVVEYFNDSLVSYYGAPLKYPVLTNTLYSTSRKYYKKQIKDHDNSCKQHWGYSSLARFVKAQCYLKQFQSNSKAMNTKQALNMMRQLSQPSNTQWQTQWTVIYNLKTQKIIFAKNDHKIVLNYKKLFDNPKRFKGQHLFDF